MKALSGITVLLVEDHEDSREAIRRWLQWKGCQVFTAGDQKTALALARQHSLDLLICDLQLPDGNGWELMKQLKNNKPTVALMTSGHCAPADIAKSKSLGFIDHLIKPYPVEELDAWLTRVQKQLLNGRNHSRDEEEETGRKK